MRDYVIGVRAVDGDGTEFAGGGRVVKNAAGYDLCRLLTGSLGTLAVITQVTLMVKPTADTSAMMACDVADFDTAERLLAGLVQTETLPTAIELLVGPAWQDDSSLGPMAAGSVGRLLVAFEGTAPEVDWMVDSLGSQWRQCGIAAPVTIPVGRVDAMVGRLTDFPVAASQDNGSASLVVQISVLPSATVATVQRLLEVAPGCSLQVHAGNGVIRGRFSREPNTVAAMLREELRPLVVAAGGTMAVLSYPRDVELNIETVWGPPGDGATVMRAIKDRFDPNHILNPGRFIYGS